MSVNVLIYAIIVMVLLLTYWGAQVLSFVRKNKMAIHLQWKAYLVGVVYSVVMLNILSVNITRLIGLVPIRVSVFNVGVDFPMSYAGLVAVLLISFFAVLGGGFLSRLRKSK